MPIDLRPASNTIVLPCCIMTVPSTVSDLENPRTKFPWGVTLQRRPGVYAPKIHRGRMLFLSEETAALADPICRAEIARTEAADPEWERLLRHLGNTGPSLLEDVQVELELKARELRKLRLPLERCGAILARPVTVQTEDGGHVHTSELARWDHAFTRPTRDEPDLGALVVAGVRAAVVVPENEPRRWFSWVWRWDNGLVDRLVAEGRLERPEPGRLTAA